MMKRKLLMLTLSVMLVLSGCGQEADKRAVDSKLTVESSAEQPGTAVSEETKTPEKKESASASGETTVKKETEKAETKDATATPEPTQKPETEKETKSTQKPVTTAAPETTKAPASTPKADKVQTSTGSTQTSSDSNQSGADNTAQSSPTSAPVSAPVVNDPTPEPHTQCTWDGGSVTQNASCTSEGTTTYTCNVCGNTKTESIAKTSHNYVTETTEATCTTGGSSKTYCSICGDVQSETTTGGGLGHDFYMEFFNNQPTCSGAAYYMLICTRCGESGGDGTAPALGHSPVSEEICHGDCVTQTIVVTTCSSCGLELGRTGHYENEHDWVTGVTDPEWSEEAQDFVTYEVTYCSRCYAKP